MNVDLMLRVADAIERENIANFDMHEWINVSRRHSCGTAACVAGFVCLMEAQSTKWMSDRDVMDDAADYLGIDALDAEVLFLGEYTRHTLGELSGKLKKYVPDAIRWMALSGNVSWNKGIKMARCVAKEEKKRAKA